MDDSWVYPENGADPWVLPPPHPMPDHSALFLSVLGEGKAPPRNPPFPSGFLASKLQCFEYWLRVPPRHGSEAWCSVGLASSRPRIK